MPLTTEAKVPLAFRVYVPRYTSRGPKRVYPRVPPAHSEIGTPPHESLAVSFPCLDSRGPGMSNESVQRLVRHPFPSLLLRPLPGVVRRSSLRLGLTLAPGPQSQRHPKATPQRCAQSCLRLPPERTQPPCLFPWQCRAVGPFIFRLCRTSVPKRQTVFTTPAGTELATTSVSG